MEAENNLVNLCDSCEQRDNFPECIPDNQVFGNGQGYDNIIECENYPEQPHQ